MPIMTFDSVGGESGLVLPLGVRQVPDTQRVISGAVTDTVNIIPTPGAGSQLRIRLAQVTNEIDDLVSVTFQESGAGPVQGFAGAMAAKGGGSNIDWGEGWVLGDNEALFMTVTARGGVLLPITNVSILEYFIVTP